MTRAGYSNGSLSAVLLLLLLLLLLRGLSLVLHSSLSGYLRSIEICHRRLI